MYDWHRDEAIRIRALELAIDHIGRVAAGSGILSHADDVTQIAATFADYIRKGMRSVKEAS
jgi:hypothetical protein